ncbi:hypothetical protein VV02_15890 [Luteipulveratus mongoliensis]|uniref:N-acetylmuramoyl-L-alanine amidase domain-containing protein n=2 Tax=Luteipulveratus mongoliensis TaxID=571913 RepID=A0A0K1JJU9_9MICO|nr:hypothetical protein VV02_15890 [Luteipulveratus mongoliensis]
MSRRDLIKTVSIGASATALSAAGALSLAGHASADDLIQSRDSWGFDGWAKPVPEVDRAERTTFVVHWQGPKRNWVKDIVAGDEIENGPGAPKQMHEIAKDDDGPGIEYNFVITQHGEIYEGRGWDLLAGAVEGFNTPAISAQVHIREGTGPSREALDALAALYRRANQVLAEARPGGGRILHALEVSSHHAHYDTECPGPDLLDWVKNTGPGLRAEADARITPPAFPGRDAFQIGHSDPSVRMLHLALVRACYTRHPDDASRPNDLFTEATRLNVRDFQLAQGWTGSGADGYPGPKTWDLLTR